MENKETPKLVSLTVVKDFGIIKAQSIPLEFANDILCLKVKGGTGQGKTSLVKAMQTVTGGHNAIADKLAYGDFELELIVIDDDKKLFINAKKKADNQISYEIYIKDNNGKKIKNPIIRGISMSAAKYIELLRTELTFGVDKFLSKSESEHFEFMFGSVKDAKKRGLFTNQLEKLGIIFNKTLPEYRNSILHKIDNAIEQRTNIFHTKVKPLNATKTALIKDEIYDEKNNLLFLSPKPDMILLSKQKNDIEMELMELRLKINSYNSTKKADAENEKLKKINEIENEILKYTNKGTDAKTKIQNFNSEKNEEYKNELNKKTRLTSALTQIKTLLFENEELSEYFSYTKAEKMVSEIKSPTLLNVPLKLDELKKFDLNLISDWYYEIKESIVTLLDCIDKIEILNLQKSEISNNNAEIKNKNFDYDFEILINKIELSEIETKTLSLHRQLSEIKNEIENAKVISKTWERIDANIEHKEADLKVKQLYSEFNKLLEPIDLGLSGLHLKVIAENVGEDNERQYVRTYFDGAMSEYPEYFGNNDLLLTEYSETQMAFIAVLLQIHLLNKENHKYSLRAIWIETPLDSRGFNLLNKIAKEQNVIIFTSWYGDFTKENLQENEILVENGWCFFNEKLIK